MSAKEKASSSKPRAPEKSTSQRYRQRLIGLAVLAVTGIIILPQFSQMHNVPARTSQLPTLPARPNALTAPKLASEPEFVANPDLKNLPRQNVETRALSANEQQAWLNEYAKLNTKPSSPKLTTPEPSTAVSIKQGFVVQLATFEKFSNADELLRKLRKDGYRGYLEQSADQRYYQVFVGPQLRRQDAELAKASLLEALKLVGVVKAFKP